MRETSGDKNYDFDIATIGEEALERCGLNAADATGKYSDVIRRSMNLFMSELVNIGILQWTITEIILPLQSGIGRYSFDPADGVIDVDSVSVRTSEGESGYTDIPMTRMSWDDYTSYPNKDTPGRPNFYVLHRLKIPELILWQVPDSDIYSLYIVANCKPDIFKASGDSPDVPFRFMEMLCAGLAAKLAVKVAPDRYPLLQPMAEKTLREAIRADTEGVDVKVRTGMRFGNS